MTANVRAIFRYSNMKLRTAKCKIVAEFNTELCLTFATFSLATRHGSLKSVKRAAIACNMPLVVTFEL